MPRQVHVNVDKPITVFGLDLEDFGTLAGAFGVAYMVLKFFIPKGICIPIAGLIAVVLAFLVSWIKVRRPPGYLLHKVWTLGVPVPGFFKHVKGGTRLSS